MSRSTVPVDPSRDARVAFLAGLLDDAGMFPPARLPLPEAAARHADDLARRGWLLNRFLCPASRLDELAALLPAAGGWRVGVVSDRSIDVDVPAVAAFADKFDGVVDDVEVRAAGDDPVAAAVRAAKTIGQIPGVVAHVEVPLDDRWQAVVPAFVDAVAGMTEAAVKMRCGGETADAFPSTEQLAEVISACHRAGVAL